MITDTGKRFFIKNLGVASRLRKPHYNRGSLTISTQRVIQPCLQQWKTLDKRLDPFCLIRG